MTTNKLENMPQCPQCGSESLSKNGRSQNRHRTQRYKCRECGYQFTPTSHLEPHRPIKNLLPSDRQCCKITLWRIGFNNGSQMWRCRKCKKTYIDREDY